MKKRKFAIEMGGGYTCIYVNGEGLALKEPTLVAVECSEEGYKVIAMGLEAKKMIGKTGDNIEIFTPVVYGENSNYDYSVVLLRYFLDKVDFKPFIDNAIFIIPCGITADEKEKILNVCDGVELGDVELVPSVICSCLGAGRNVDNSKANLVVDIGGFCTDVAVVNMSGVLKGATVGVGGKGIDASIVNYLACTQGILIGLSTAEILKNEVGSLYANDTLNMEVTGVDVSSKTPKSMLVVSKDLINPIEPFYNEIVRVVETTVNTLPPEIIEDVINNKVLIVGGCAKMQGLDNYLKKHLDFPVEFAEDLENSTILGAGKLLSDTNLLDNIVKNL